MFEIGDKVVYNGVIPYRKGTIATVMDSDSDNPLIKFDDNSKGYGSNTAYGINSYIVPAGSITRVVMTTELQTALQSYRGIFPVTFYSLLARDTLRGLEITIFMGSGIYYNDIIGAMSSVYESLNIYELLPNFYDRGYCYPDIDDDGSDCSLTYTPNNSDFDVQLVVG